MQTRVAIVGGAGFVGRNVCDCLKPAGHETRIFSRTTGCDFAELSESWKVIDQFRPDYVVNCAAFVGSVNFVSDFAADVVDTNMRILLNLYKIAQQLRNCIIINPVANCAYPGVMDHYEEDRLWDGPPHPTVLSYGSTRRMMIVLSRCYASQYGVRSVNIMVPNMYGPFDSTNPNKTHALNALAIKFVRAVKQSLPEIEVWGTGHPVREWLYVKDCASVIRRIIELGDDNPEIVNIGQNHGYSINELVQVLTELSGFKGKIVHNTGYPDGAPRKVMDDHRFRSRFPDFRFTSLEDGLGETMNYYEELL